ncbi:hypothetical protein GF412_00685, partial [Candidatus Micrarchaeota archaeon]|nr:hypothetical protein [Candidatus Micrarchaeota archaeon]MBD3417489.1 hypothetical protein [Candidatus Micrarchaeota archaeon]
MAIKGSVQEKKKAAEKKVEKLIGNIAGKMDDSLEADALRELVGPKQDEKREGHTIWFEEGQKTDFEKLASLFSDLGVKAAVAYDSESEMWTFSVGKDVKEMAKKPAAESPFKQKTPAPVERAVPKPREKEEKTTKEQEKKELAKSLKQVSGRNGEGMLQRVRKLMKWKEQLESAQKRLETLQGQTPETKAGRDKRVKSIVAEQKTIKRLKKRIEEQEDVLRKFLADYKKIKELSTGIGDKVMASLKPYALASSSKRAQKALNEPFRPLERAKKQPKPEQGPIPAYLGEETPEPVSAKAKKPKPEKEKEYTPAEIAFANWRNA